MSAREQLIKDALDTVQVLLARYRITSAATASRLMRDRATQEDLTAYEKAIKVIHNNGGI